MVWWLLAALVVWIPGAALIKIGARLSPGFRSLVERKEAEAWRRLDRFLDRPPTP